MSNAAPETSGTLWAISDLHVGHGPNREIVEGLRPTSDEDWLLVAGDVADQFADFEWAMAVLAGRFRHVVWAPGNHELWTPPGDPVQERGENRYRMLVDRCRQWGISTPDDEFRVWRGAGGPALIAPLFVLYDYSFRVPGVATTEEALARAYAANVVCTDEMLLHPDPHASRAAWCAARVAVSEERLAACDPELPTVLMNHFPLTREPTDHLRYPDFGLWCGTEATARWHVRFNAAAVVYGHLHLPRRSVQDGVSFLEVSVGYPEEWTPRGWRVDQQWLHPVLPRAT